MNAGQIYFFICLYTYVYNFFKNAFYNHFTAGKYFMCFMQNVYGNTWVRNVFHLLNVSSTKVLYVSIPSLSCAALFISFTIIVSSSCRLIAHTANVYCL